MNILYATSEVYPLIKTGGLADVSGSLPQALLEQEQDVRLIIPAYQALMQKLKRVKWLAQTHHYGLDVKLLQSSLPGTKVKVLLVDCPELFDRAGNPYLDPTGNEWSDNPLRFALYCQVVVDVALDRLGLGWIVDVVHCNDWQSALVPALLSGFEPRPATLFTIHNLAYQGLYSKQTFFDLALPHALWGFQGVEFHDYFSFIKGALSFAERLNTVSPQYAREVQSEQFGFGLQDLLRHRDDRFSGVLNGLDTTVWNPASDTHITHNYDENSLAEKLLNKSALQKKSGLAEDENVPMIGFIGRLVEQKGLELILESMPELLKMPIQLVFLGTGEEKYETALRQLADSHPRSIAAHIGYDEKLAHQIEAACDLYLMPSLFEPCGLNQLYSLRYGTIPLVTPVGGLADSVIDCHDETLSDKTATGFVMAQATADELVDTLQRALAVYRQAALWTQLQVNAMQQDFSWEKSAAEYIKLYKLALHDNETD